MLHSLSVIHLPTVGITLERGLYRALADFLEYAEHILSCCSNTPTGTALAIDFPFLMGMGPDDWEDYTPVNFCEQASQTGNQLHFVVEWELQPTATSASPNTTTHHGFWTWGRTFEAALEKARNHPASSRLAYPSESSFSLMSSIRSLLNEPPSNRHLTETKR